MNILLVIVLLALLAWKGYFAWKRGRNTYMTERERYQSLWEYLVGNGATEREARRPFLERACKRALLPWLRQWRYWLVVGVLLVLICLTACAEQPKTAQKSQALQQPQTARQSRTATQQPDYCVVKFSFTKSSKLLQRYAYRSWYNESLRLPLAVSWYLTGDHTRGNNQRKNQQFHPDTDVKNPTTTQDYVQSGYDRGHMCPAGDNKWNLQALDETFLMTNICPQNHNLNKNDWNDLELLCRQWARKYGKVYIVCGPLLRGTQHREIGPRSRRITVPEGFYKVVLRLGKTPAAIGFVYDNKGSRQPMKQAVRTVDEVEKLTGLDFFSSLDDLTEDRIEAKASLDAW